MSPDRHRSTAARPAGEQPVPSPRAVTAPARVLVVDDERNIRLTLQAFLRDSGYDVSLADDASQARALLALEAWDVVLTDIVLPGASGLDLLKAIRAAAPDVQVIMMTGEPTVETAAEAVRAGARDYLTKPVIKNAMLRSVATAVQVRRIETEKRRLQLENRQYQENLERLVAERTQALQSANARLESAMAEIQRSQREIIKQERLAALGQMVSGIAHDFNNALMPIVGLSGYFLSEPGALDNREQLRADIEAIHRSAAAAVEVVRRLREFYRPDDEMGVTDADLRKLVDHVILLTEPAWRVQAAAEGRDVRIVNAIGDLPLVPANEPRLREALVNLVLNALDAMPGGGTIRLDAQHDAEAVSLSISDTGTGMSDDVRNRCFEPFFTTKGTHGSGLGLAMVYGIVTRHGGQITVASQTGKGTTFTIRLPLARRATTHPPPTPAAPVSAPAPALKVLVVDDEDWALSLIQRFLGLRGHAVLTAASGRDALEIFAREPTDLVITDRAIPDMSGDRIAAEIKRMSSQTPVIMLTGFGDIMDVRKEKPPAVDHVLAKPVTPEQLQEAVVRAMAAREGGLMPAAGGRHANGGAR